MNLHSGMPARCLALLAAAVLLMGAAGAVRAEGAPAEAGGIVTFGSYEQDNDLSDGQEAIEWIVLEVGEDRALLLSLYALQALPFNTQYPSFFRKVTWETCEMRIWLNGEFLDTAFTPEEREAILLTEVENGGDQGNPDWGNTTWKNTQDRVFLLSYAQVRRYLPAAQDRVCFGTDYARTQYPSSPSFSYAEWWLRSPGPGSRQAAMVQYNGSIERADVVYLYALARPAVWVALDQLPR